MTGPLPAGEQSMRMVLGMDHTLGNTKTRQVGKRHPLCKRILGAEALTSTSKAA